MRFSVTPFRHREYLALRERSESLALLWGVGHAFFVLFLALALITPLGVALVAMIDSDITGERAWSVAEASTVATLLFAAIGFAARRYASKKGGISSERR
jgi:hypothetical protein